MNSEELEQSLRTEFESYLKNVIAEMRQEVSDFRTMVDAEFEKHKSQMDEAFRNFGERFDSDRNLDAAFTDTVIEHLRLARDEGARITATAIAEAEELQKEQVAATDSSVVVSEIRDAIRDISSKTTQSAILKSLVAHAANFTPRGAFFIIKNEHLVGWRVFGSEADVDDKSVREVFFPAENDTLLGSAVSGLKTVEAAFGSHGDDNTFLSGLGFGQPDRMYAIPLVVRERAVAVLYADYGNEGVNVNVEALESLVQVAGLTVEISASARAAKAQPEAETRHEVEQPEPQSYEDVERSEPVGYDFEQGETEVQPEASAPEDAQPEETVESSASFEENQFDSTYSFTAPQSEESVEPVEEESHSVSEVEETSEDNEFTATSEVSGFETAEFESATEFQMTETAEFESATEFQITKTAEFESTTEFQINETTETADVSDFSTATEWSDAVSVSDDFSKPEFETTGFESFEPTSFETVEEPVAEFSSPSSVEYEFESVQPAGTSNVEFETVSPAFEAPQSFGADEPVVTPVVVAEPVVAPPTQARSRLSERNVDLPIEVSEDERRLHNDARRFARLLVSEIKLYNEQKVKEGRDLNALYEKLREAIDRSREMYDKRVQPPVAAKFDYFHYELVSNLAEGDEGKLGGSYPGTSV